MNAVATRTPVGAIGGEGLVLAEEPGDPSQALTRAYTGHLADTCRHFFAVENEIAPAQIGSYAQIAALVRDLLARRRGPVLACFASPAVSAAIRCADLRGEVDAFGERIDLAVSEMMPHLLLELALRGLIPQGRSILWQHGSPRLASLATGGELIAPAGASGLRFSASHIAAVAGDGELARIEARREAMAGLPADGGADEFRFERCYWPLGGVTHLATIDRNPIAEFEAHPDKAGNHIDLGGRPRREWVEMLDGCFELVESFMPGELAEMKRVLQQAIPVGYDDHRHLSASYREAVGTIYLTLHPSVMIMAEALVHEFQHNKFNVAAYSAEFLTNAFYPLFKSPVRPDPRPLWGIMLAVHAFLPVAELYRRMREGGHPLAQHPDFERRMSEIDLKNHEGMEMLRANAQLTPAGRAMMDDLERLERAHLSDRIARGLENTPTSIHLA